MASPPSPRVSKKPSYQAIYTREAAKTQTTALTIQNAFSGYALEGKVDVEAGGKIKSGKATTEVEKGVKYLSTKEAQDCWETFSGIVGRPWELWVREVEVEKLYRNECPGGE